MAKIEKLDKLERLKLKVDIKTLTKKISILKFKGESSLENEFMILDLKGDLELSKYLLKQDSKKTKKIKNEIGFTKPKKDN